jgi:four helix bundle protein
VSSQDRQKPDVVASYRDLVVWQRAMELVSAVYRVTAAFPEEERFGLTTQLRRSAVSIPSNIAEGQGRTTTREFHRFLGIARGSVKELETQMLIALDLGYAGDAGARRCLDLAEEVGRMLHALLKALERKEQVGN